MPVAGPWDNDPVAPAASGPWANDPPVAGQPAAIDLHRQPAVSPEDWFRQTYGFDPAAGGNGTPPLAFEDVDQLRAEQDPAGRQAWYDEQVRMQEAMLGRPLPTTEQMNVPFDTNNTPLDWARAAGQGIFGLGDEFEGAVHGIGGLLSGEGWQPAYDRGVTNARNEITEFDTAHPIPSTVLELAGAVPTAFVPGMAAAARGVTTLGKVGRGLVAGAAAGGATGFGLGEGSPLERLPGAIQGAIPGAGAGALLPLAAPAVARLLTGRQGGSALTGLVPESTASAEQRSMLARDATTEDWHRAGQEAYRRADEAGVAVGPQAYNDFVLGIDAAIRNEPGGLLHQALTPRSWAVYDELHNLAGQSQYTISDLDTIRRLANAAATSADRTDARSGRIIRDSLDEWFETLKPADILAGNVQEAAAALREARDAWGRYRRSEILDQIQERAEDAVGANFTQAGLQTALRQQFRALKRSRQYQTFTFEERQVIDDIVRGEPLENALRRLGTFAPRGFFSNMFALGGLMTSDPFMLGATAVGEVARRASTALGNRNVARLGDLVRRNTDSRPPPSFGTQQATLGALTAGAGFTSPRLGLLPEEWLPVPAGLQ